jgi:uncharacterized cupin superfamily protein
MPKIDVDTAPVIVGSRYPLPFRLVSPARRKQQLGDAGGLKDFGVNKVDLPPGEWSSQRHWHSNEDELVYVLAGEVTLIEDDGETILRAGDCAAFPKGAANGHHLVNRSTAMATYLEVGTRTERDACSYPDVDLHMPADGPWFTKKDGTPYPQE